MGKRRQEFSTSGADQGLQGLSSDPFVGKTGTPAATGLRIPALVNGPDNRYLFLLATRVVNSGFTRVLGIRQYLEIGLDIAPQLGIETERPVTLSVVTPTFRFSDGANVSWHLVKEPTPTRDNRTPRTQAPSFGFQTSDSPALLYAGFTAANVTATGAPVNYPVDLTSYTPPTWVNDWQPIAGLKALRDIRYPWVDNQAWDSIDEVVGGGSWRISLYASVLQTNPLTRPGIIYGPTIATDGSAVGGPPEEDFIYKFTFPTSETAPAQGPQFWRIAGSILFEDEVDGGDLKQRLPGGP